MLKSTKSRALVKLSSPAPYSKIDASLTGIDELISSCLINAGFRKLNAFELFFSFIPNIYIYSIIQATEAVTIGAAIDVPDLTSGLISKLAPRISVPKVIKSGFTLPIPSGNSSPFQKFLFNN